MKLNFLHILLIILCFQFLFISIFLFQVRKGKVLSNRLLSVVFLLLGLSLINLLRTILGVANYFPYILFFEDSFFLLYGPLILLFTRSVLFKNYQLNSKVLPHFVSFALFVVVLLYVFITFSSTEIDEMTASILALQIPWLAKAFEFVFFTHIFFYLIWSLKEIRSVNKSALESLSNIDQNNSKYLLNIIYSFITIFVLAMVHSFLIIFKIPLIIFITVPSLIVYIFYFVNSILFKMLNHSTNESGLLPLMVYYNQRKYASSILTPESLMNYKNRLSSHMQLSKPYLESDINIQSLAEQLSISPKTLSQIINEGFSQNFFDYINRYRVIEAQAKFQENDNNTIQSIMYDCGFNSKSSFNTAFKKFTNMTPSQFKSSLKKNGSTS